MLEEVACDVVAMSGGWSPVVHLWSHCGGKLTWDEAQAHFRPDAKRPPTNQDGEAMVMAVGSANGHLSAAATLADVAAQMGGKAATAAAVIEAPMEAVWIMPQGAGIQLKSKMWLDYQNDVKVSDVQLAAREGYTSVEHTKR